MNKLDFLVIDFGLFCILSYCYKDKKVVGLIFWEKYLMVMVDV